MTKHERKIPSLADVIFNRDTGGIAGSAPAREVEIGPLADLLFRALGGPNIQSGFQSGGIPGAIGGFGRSLLEGTKSLQDTLIDNPAAALEQLIPLGSPDSFFNQLSAGFTGEPVQALAEPGGTQTQLPVQPSLATAPAANPLSFQTPFQNFTVPDLAFPESPQSIDFSGARPTPPTGFSGEDRIGAIIRGLAAGAQQSPVGAEAGRFLLSLGTGALAETGRQDETARLEQARFTEKEDEFNQFLALQRASEAERQFAKQVQETQFTFKLDQARQKAEKENRAQLVPSIKNGYIVQPVLDEKTGIITSTLSPLPSTKLQAKADIARLGAEFDTELLIDTLLAEDPAIVQKIAESIGTSPQALRGFGFSEGKTNTAAMAAVISALRESTDPELAGVYDTLVAEAQKRAVIRALGGFK